MWGISWLAEKPVSWYAWRRDRALRVKCDLNFRKLIYGFERRTLCNDLLMLHLHSSTYTDDTPLLFDALLSRKLNCSLSARFGARAASVLFREAFITAPWHSLAADRRDKLNLANLQPGWWVSRDTREVLGSVGHYVRTYGTSGNADISETKFVNAPCDGAFVTLPVPFLWDL